MSETEIRNIGKYKVTEKIGDGGMGEILKAEADGKIFAIKLIDRKFSTQMRSHIQERFEQEIETLEKLSSHSNIVKYYDNGEENSERYLVMEYIEGHTLKHYLKRNRKFSLEETAKIITSVLNALDFCHGIPIIHRDIKPDNIMLMEDKDHTVKVIDFGIVRVEGGEMTLPGNVIGTLPYMSPEQLTGRGEEIDHLSDIYAVGLVLYELLTGKQAFPAQRLPEAQGQRKQPPPVPSAYREGIPSHLDDIFLKAVNSEKAKRFQSADEFSKAIINTLEGLEIDPSTDNDANLAFAAELRSESALQHFLLQENRFRTWLKSAQAGNLQAQWLTGLCYSFGCGTDSDSEQELIWFQTAAETNHKGAQYRMGFLIEKKQFMDQEQYIKEALGWYRQAAAEPGYPLAQYRLGLHCWLGNINPEESDNHPSAFEYFQSAAEQNYPPACEALGTHYEHGWDTNKDDKTALVWYKRAANGGDARALAKLGFRYRDGRGVGKDDAQALDYIMQAAEGGDAEAQFELANRYREGIGLTRDSEKAQLWLQAAAEKLYPPAVELMKELFPQQYQQDELDESVDYDEQVTKVQLVDPIN